MSSSSRARALACVALAAAVTVSACTAKGGTTSPPPMSRAQVIASNRTWAPKEARNWTSPADRARGLNKIRHIVMIMQENRSFDSYFGTFPGADGIPTTNGKPVPCLPVPGRAGCLRPFPDHHDVNGGGPHGKPPFFEDVDGGRMDGCVRAATRAAKHCTDPNDPACSNGSGLDVMGYHTRSDIPNYWAYAESFVLQDHMFEPIHTWSLPAHLWAVSGWAAYCRNRQPFSCTNVNGTLGPDPPTGWIGDGRHTLPGQPVYAWTDLTYLLHRHHVSWGYYVTVGKEPDCENSDVLVCRPVKQSPKTPGIWNPMPNFVTVQADHELRNIRATSVFRRQDDVSR